MSSLASLPEPPLLPIIPLIVFTACTIRSRLSPSVERPKLDVVTSSVRSSVFLALQKRVRVGNCQHEVSKLVQIFAARFGLNPAAYVNRSGSNRCDRFDYVFGGQAAGKNDWPEPRALGCEAPVKRLSSSPVPAG